MPACANTNSYAGDLGLRISSIFVILIGSALGASIPVLISHCKRLHAPTWTKWLSFAARHVGSGVILGTAVIHLLAPAHEALQNPCLPAGFHSYSWTEGIMLTSMLAICFIEVISLRLSKRSTHVHHFDVRRRPNSAKVSAIAISTEADTTSSSPYEDIELESHPTETSINKTPPSVTEEQEEEEKDTASPSTSLAAQITAILILEFGILFHSAFVGLALAVSGPNFTTLYIVLTFHQTLEGIALGSRIASVAWPTRRKYSAPSLLVLLFALSTPLAIAVGLAVRARLNPDSATGLILSGVMYAVSAGVLVYTALVELLAGDFVYGDRMREAPWGEVVAAFVATAMGAGTMALVGKWT